MNTKTQKQIRTILKNAQQKIRDLYYNDKIDINENVKFAGRILSLMKDLNEMEISDNEICATCREYKEELYLHDGKNYTAKIKSCENCIEMLCNQ